MNQVGVKSTSRHRPSSTQESDFRVEVDPSADGVPTVIRCSTWHRMGSWCRCRSIRRPRSTSAYPGRSLPHMGDGPGETTMYRPMERDSSPSFLRWWQMNKRWRLCWIGRRRCND